jgi:plastocyanin domain-containing protein
MRECRAAAAVFSVLAAVVAGASFGGCDKKTDGGTAPAVSAVQAQPGVPVRVTADEHGFTPGSVTIPKGAPGSTAQLVFTRTSDKTCATEVVFPDLNVKKDLPLDKPVTVDVPSDTARTLTFQCGMAMFKGALVVK